MDSIADKFDVFDFFNLVIAGAVFGIGLGFYDPFVMDCLNSVKNWTSDSIFALIIAIFVLIALCYIVGAIFNMAGVRFLRRKAYEDMVEKCLTDPRIVNNEEKLKHYISDAKSFFAEKGTPIADPNSFTPGQNSCYYAHCIYYIQVREQNGKPEKLRSVAGLSRLLTICFAVLATMLPLFMLRTFLCQRESTWSAMGLVRQSAACIACSVCARLFYLKYRDDEKNHIRMVLAVYDVCREIDKALNTADEAVREAARSGSIR